VADRLAERAMSEDGVTMQGRTNPTNASPADRALAARVRAANTLLARAARPLRVLSTIAWPPSVRDRFFAEGARELPRVSYPSFDPAPALEYVARARRNPVGHASIDAWITRHCDAIDDTARMLQGVGTSAFYRHAQRLYGDATTSLEFHTTTPLALARSVHQTIDAFARARPDFVPPPTQGAATVAGELRSAVELHFGTDAPDVRVVQALSSNALATSKEIRIRRGARFTDRDAQQLLQHEAYIHVATSLNGRRQVDLPIVGVSYPYVTRTQEGLAVFAEVITGTMELDRLRRLADRVVAIDMAAEGADFLQVYRWFVDRTDSPEQAFENARRVFRGGVLAGGAPFTKDVTYLYGLLQVTNLVRAAFSAGRADVLRTLFCGKLDIRDVPVLCELAHMKLLRAPRHVPPWVSNPRALLATLTFSTFVARIDQASLMRAAQKLLAKIPIVRF
jgi:uncharacterized protein (TIGR02421 family)